jgi:hypothetical protein
MYFVACLLTLLPSAARPEAVSPEDPAKAAPQKPEAALFARAVVVGHDISGGTGLEKELGAPGTLADVVQASLLFQPKAAVECRPFAETSVAGTQIKAAIDANATLVIALDYLIPYVYGAPADEAVRGQRVAGALKALEPLQCPIVLGDVPDLRHVLALEKPIFVEAQLPSVEALKTLNETVTAWAQARKELAVIAPVSMVFAQVQKGEGFTIRKNTWPQAWLPDLLQADRVHTRLHGTIALWLAGLDALCTARQDLDPNAFDWNALSIHKKVYAAKSRQREAAHQKAVARLKLPPNSPPPQPLPPPPPAEDSETDEKAKRRERDGDPK